MANMSLGDRMKMYYEERSQTSLDRRTPVIMRLDGKAFHTVTKHCEKPFDDKLRNCLIRATRRLLSEMQGARCAFLQSDEISILLIDYDTLTSEAWFDYNVQKLNSISSGILSVQFSIEFTTFATFDSRVFNIPGAEVNNYFVWRQKDWERNSIQMLARAHFSHKECHNKKIPDLHEMLYTKHINWTDLESYWKNGTLITKQSRVEGLRSEWIDEAAPIFTQSRDVIDNMLLPLERVSND